MIQKGVIHNSAIYNNKLSWKAKGLIIYFLSAHNDNSVTFEELRISSKDGRDSLTNGLKELIEHGYIIRTQTRTENGSFGAWSYTIC